MYIKPKIHFECKHRPSTVKMKMEQFIKDSDHDLLNLIISRFEGYVYIDRFKLVKVSPKTLYEYKRGPFHRLSIIEGKITEKENGSSIQAQIHVNDIHAKVFGILYALFVLMAVYGYMQRTTDLIYNGAFFMLLLYFGVSLDLWLTKKKFSQLLSQVLKTDYKSH